MTLVVDKDDAFSIETMESGSELESFVTTHDNPNIWCAIGRTKVELDFTVGEQLHDDRANDPCGLFPIEQLQLHAITRLRLNRFAKVKVCDSG